VEIIKGYRLEKDLVLKKWIVFEKVGVSAWHQVYLASKKKEAKEWILGQKKGKKK